MPKKQIAILVDEEEHAQLKIYVAQKKTTVTALLKKYIQGLLKQKSGRPEKSKGQ